MFSVFCVWLESSVCACISACVFSFIHSDEFQLKLLVGLGLEVQYSRWDDPYARRKCECNCVCVCVYIQPSEINQCPSWWVMSQVCCWALCKAYDQEKRPYMKKVLQKKWTMWMCMRAHVCVCVGGGEGLLYVYVHTHVPYRRMFVCLSSCKYAYEMCVMVH